MNSWTTNQFHDVASAFAYAFASQHGDAARHEYDAPYNDLTHFVLQQHARMTGFLRSPLKIAALSFDAAAIVTCGSRFHTLPLSSRLRLISAWKDSRIGFKRDLIRYFESLSVLELHSRIVKSSAQNLGEPLSSGSETYDFSQRQAYEVVVIGSGPGGSITAALLAEAGKKVLMLEEGDYLGLDSCTPFTRDEMVQKYRNGGQTIAMGSNKVAYVEGRCVGGGSEINSGLYHRTPPEILDQWTKQFAVEGISTTELEEHYAACERDVSVSYLPGAAPAASLKLHEGALKLGWKSLEVPRWFKHDSAAATGGGRRQSMTETFIPRFLRAGRTLLPKCRAEKIRQENGNWIITAYNRGTLLFEVEAETLFIAAGAIQTPALLRRSGITSNIGNSLRLHPTVKVVAEFPEAVNSESMGVPVHQVKQFTPRFSFGCSISTPPYLALALLDHADQARRVSQVWPHLATYYAMITGEGRGSVRNLPKFKDPLVRYNLTKNDLRDLGEGLQKLCQTLLASGAKALYPAVTGMPAVTKEDELGKIPNSLPSGMGNLMTIHLFSSCPMGEDRSKCAADSFGRVHGLKNLHIADASLLCTAPGVNPQGSIMALARRNALHFLKK